MHYLDIEVMKVEKKWLIENLKKYGNANNIAKQTGKSRTVLYRRIKKYELQHLVSSAKNYDPILDVNYNNKEWLEEMLKKHGSGKRIAEATGEKTTSVNRWIRKHGLQGSRNVGRNIRRHSLDEDFFESIDTEEKAYWLGFIVADGCIVYSGGSYSLNITLGMADIGHLKKFKTSIGSSVDITIGVSGKGTPHCQIIIHSKKIFNDLRSHGIVQRKTGNEVMPDISEGLMHHFIRGFFDGDGSTMTQSRYVKIGFHLCCASLNFMKDIKSVIDLKTSTDMRILDRGSINIMQTTGLQNCLRIYSWLYEDASIFLERKHETVNSFLSHYSSLQE